MRDLPLTPLRFNFTAHRDAEHHDQPSETQPDQTLTLREMLTRYTRGQSVPTFNPVYDEDDNTDLELPDLSKMSAIEVEELRHEIRGYVDNERKRLASRPAPTPPPVELPAEPAPDDPPPNTTE